MSKSISHQLDKDIYKSGRIVNIYDDGKIGRAKKAQIIRNEGYRVLIRFYDDWEANEVIDAWFVSGRPRSRYKFWYRKTNMWFFPFRETQKFRIESKEFLIPEYHRKFFTYSQKDSLPL